MDMGEGQGQAGDIEEEARHRERGPKGNVSSRPPAPGAGPTHAASQGDSLVLWVSVDRGCDPGRGHHHEQQQKAQGTGSDGAHAGSRGRHEARGSAPSR